MGGALGNLGDQAGRVVSDSLAERRHLDLSLVGGDLARVGVRTLELKQRKVAALLGLLGLSEKPRGTRDRVVGLLWSEVPEERAKTSLRQALHLLRQQFDATGFTGFYTDRMHIAFAPECLDVDVWRAVLGAEGGRVDPMLLTISQLSDRILEGFEDIDPSFRVWLLARRQSLQERLLSALEKILANDAAGDERAKAAEALINLDQTHEEAVRFLIRARAKVGNVSAALKLYKSLWDILDEDYDMEPSAATQSLIAEVKIGAGDFGSAGAGTSLPADSARPSEHIGPSLVHPTLVLAVEPISSGLDVAAGQHLLQGFRHSMIGCLVRFREWRVMDMQVPLATSRPQAAQFVIQTTVLHSNGALNVVLTLKDLPSGLFIWSEQFELRLETWSVLLRRVVRSITAALNVHLSAQRVTHIAEGPTISLHLYDIWLRGQALISRLEPEDWQQASRLFSDVIRAAPDFAPAYSSLVQLKNSQHIVHPGVFRDRARQSEALELARVAAALDPIDSRTQLCLAWAYAFDGQYDKAELHFELTESLNEYDPWTLMSTAQGLAFLEDAPKATRLAERALDNLIEPRPLHWGYLAGIRYCVGDYRGAYEAACRAGDFLANNGAWRAVCLVRLGYEDAAKAEAERCLRVIRERWSGGSPPSDEEITRWVMQLFPIRSDLQRETLRRSFAAAGFPVGSASA